MAKQKTGIRPAITPMPDYGKVPPQAIDMEEAVLGAVMLEKEAVITILDILRPESFYKESHQKIFKAVADVSFREFPVRSPIHILISITAVFLQREKFMMETGFRVSPTITYTARSSTLINLVFTAGSRYREQAGFTLTMQIVIHKMATGC